MMLNDDFLFFLILSPIKTIDSIHLCNDEYVYVIFVNL